MKHLLTKSNFITLAIICVWGLSLITANIFSHSIPVSPGYIGPLPIANFDAKHYLSIANNNYFPGQEAFFPVFPGIISLFRNTLGKDSVDGGILVTYTSLFVMTFMFLVLAEVDNKKRDSLWALAWLLFFPASFFFGTIYTESFFFCLLLLTLVFARKQNFFLSSIVAGLASATRVVGIFLLPTLLIELWLSRHNFTRPQLIRQTIYICLISPLGLVWYMWFSWKRSGDPLIFVHALSTYGPQRTVNHFTLLPQVMYRYIKIFLTPTLSPHDFWISRFEFVMFTIVFLLLIIFWKRIRPSYLFFSLAALILPTLTGSFSSIPRYALVCFPVYFILGSIKPRFVQLPLLIISGLLMITLAAFFFRGYFIA